MTLLDQSSYFPLFVPYRSWGTFLTPKPSDLNQAAWDPMLLGMINK